MSRTFFENWLLTQFEKNYRTSYSLTVVRINFKVGC